MVELSIGDAIFVVLAGEKQDLALYEDWRMATTTNTLSSIEQRRQ